ncbi:MAG: XRE family transcriptional regulator [Gammaproteobacteria bacterium]|jgi:hypothetical protein|nr:MAG: XRE family transcriptional regulator [Gammaproteobacteria bacterium]
MNDQLSRQNQLNPDLVLSKALLRAGTALKLTQSDLAKIVGKDRATLKNGIRPDSISGQLASLVIRLYRSLYVLVGGKSADMQHWLKTENRHTRGTPREQIKTVTGLTEIVNYLDAMRGKT